jgi:hypothetical protein
MILLFFPAAVDDGGLTLTPGQVGSVTVSAAATAGLSLTAGQQGSLSLTPGTVTVLVLS